MYLYHLWENEETRHKSLKFKRYCLYQEFPEEPRISLKAIKYFYQKKANLSYKKITVREPHDQKNYVALTGFLEYIKLKLDSNYLLFSLDETSFGRDDMRRYGWAPKG